MSSLRKVLFIAVATLACGESPVQSQAKEGGTPSATLATDAACAKAGPKGCVELALQAMGGRERLASIETLRLDEIGNTLLAEQSYRQEPFITSYERTKATIDFKKGRVRRETRLTWPESDPAQAESDSILIATAGGGVYHSAEGDRPCGLSDLDAVKDELALGPARLLLTALESRDLHFDAPEVLRTTPHTVVAFTWRDIPVRILLNPFTHLPDAVESTRTFEDFWHFWGDVKQRIYLEGYQALHGLVYPTNFVEERNGILWRSTQILNLELNLPAEDNQFPMDEKVAAQSAQGNGWERSFQAAKGVELAPGITLYPGAWNATVIQQDDGLYILEAPISGTYFEGVVEQAKKLHPGAEIRAVFSTSDSWPHVGGVRQVVAKGLPVYILDLNRPLLDRLMSAPHTIHRDLLAQSPKRPQWKIVAGKVVVGSGANRVELYPIRGASTERQYLVYFPEQKILYASDTLALNQDGSLYDPELMHEVAAAVKREGLDVKTVFAMHEGPTPWEKVQALLRAAGVAE